MKAIIKAIAVKHQCAGIDIHVPATQEETIPFEQKAGFKLPADFAAFYNLCNGFGCV